MPSHRFSILARVGLEIAWVEAGRIVMAEVLLRTVLRSRFFAEVRSMMADYYCVCGRDVERRRRVVGEWQLGVEVFAVVVVGRWDDDFSGWSSVTLGLSQQQCHVNPNQATIIFTTRIHDRISCITRLTIYMLL